MRGLEGLKVCTGWHLGMKLEGQEESEKCAGKKAARETSRKPRENGSQSCGKRDF